ncbi:MAG: hypothetical protein ACUVWB_10010, partial [Anaerolineae bacterium]
FDGTLPRRLGTLISLGARLAGLGLRLRHRQWHLPMLLLAGAVIVAGSAAWRARESTVYLPEPQWANFSNQFALVASQVEPLAGQGLTLRLWWLSLAQPNDDFKFFVHVEDAAGRRWAQEDRQPVFNASPTTRWGENELVWEYYRIPLPADAPPGEYRLYVGVYGAETLVNLDLLDIAGAPQGQRFLVETFRLQRP